MGFIACFGRAIFWLAVAALRANGETVFPDPTWDVASYYGGGPEDICLVSLDMIFIVDVSESIANDLPLAKSTLVDAFRIFRRDDPDVRLSLYSFIDKPDGTFGYRNKDGWSDHCLKQVIPLGASEKEYINAVDGLSAAGGKAFPEGQAEALLRLALSKEPKWRDSTGATPAVPGGETREASAAAGPAAPRQAVRVVVVVTDATANLPGGKVFEKNETHLRPNDLLGHPEVLEESGLDAECGEMDFPTSEDVGTALRRARIIPVFLVAPPTWEQQGCDAPEGQVCIFREVGTKRHGTPSEAVDALVTWYEKLLHNMSTPGIVRRLDAGLKDLYGEINELAQGLGMIGVDCDDGGVSVPSGFFPTFPAEGSCPFCELFVSCCGKISKISPGQSVLAHNRR